MIDFSKELNAEQRAVVEQAAGSCLVLAGAGTGKTRTIVYRVAWLLEHGVTPGEMLLLTFTNKAAREMLERVAALSGKGAQGIVGGTFHHVANRFLRHFPQACGFQPQFTILDQDDARNFLKACIKDAGIETTGRRFPQANVLLAIISFSRNSDLPLMQVLEERFPSFFPLSEEIERVASVYTEAKQRAQTMDFDDLLIHFRDLLKQHEPIRQSLAQQFRHLFVDEYQDTNRIQADIVRLLAHPEGNVVVVGDDAQSIYSFRAADIGNILSFPEIFSRAKTFRLETNYRSTQKILDFANDIITHNVHQFEKNLKSSAAHGEAPHVIPCRDGREEAARIADRILQFREEGVALEDMAVLFRASHHSQELEFELAKRDIPYEYRGGMRFFERAHIKDVIAFLKIAANPKDRVAWFRVLTLFEGIGPALASRIVQDMRGEILSAMIDSVSASARARSGWEQAKSVLGALTDLSFDHPHAFVEALLDSPYTEYLTSTYPNAEERIDDIQQFAEFAGRATSLSEFLSEVTLVEDMGVARRGDDLKNTERLILSTIHQAKGLEWHTVFIMRLVEDAFPNPRALRENRGEEEERRLFYVAATRAKRGLYLTYPLSSGSDRLFFHEPSRFITERNPRFYEMASPMTDEEKIIEYSFLPDINEL